MKSFFIYSNETIPEDDFFIPDLWGKPIGIKEKTVFFIQKYIFFSDYKSQTQKNALSLFGKIMAIECGIVLDSIIHHLFGM